MTVVHPEIIDTVFLRSGAHDTFENGACLLEAVSYVAGEPFSDSPSCVCPVLAAFGRSWNDTLDDEARNRLLKPFIPRLIGTKSTSEVQDARVFMAADWAVRTFTPAWLRKAGLAEDAAALEALTALSSVDLCKAAMPVISKARSSAAAAGVAARVAARAAAEDAVQDAAWDAARVAARVATGIATWDATWDAAGVAARDAARAAADAAAASRDALQDTVVELQASAVELLDRMIAVGGPNDC